MQGWHTLRRLAFAEVPVPFGALGGACFTLFNQTCKRCSVLLRGVSFGFGERKIRPRRVELFLAAGVLGYQLFDALQDHVARLDTGPRQDEIACVLGTRQLKAQLGTFEGRTFRRREPRIDGEDFDLTQEQFTGDEVINEVAVVADEYLRNNQATMKPEVAARLKLAAQAIRFVKRGIPKAGNQHEHVYDTKGNSYYRTQATRTTRIGNRVESPALKALASKDPLAAKAATIAATSGGNCGEHSVLAMHYLSGLDTGQTLTRAGVQGVWTIHQRHDTGRTGGGSWRIGG